MAELSRLPVPARTPEGPFGAESATGQRRRWGPRRRVTSRLLVSHVDRVQEASEKDLLEGCRRSRLEARLCGLPGLRVDDALDRVRVELGRHTLAIDRQACGA